MKAAPHLVPLSLALYLSLPTIAAFAGQQPQQPMQPVEVQVMHDEADHKKQLADEDSNGTTRFGEWGFTTWWAKLKHKWSKPSEWKEQKEKIDQNLGGFEPSLHIFSASTCAATMMEKHYAGIASVKLGAGYFRQIQIAMQEMGSRRTQALQVIVARCQKDLDAYKAQKKSKDIERIKVFSQEEREHLDGFLGELFSETPESVAMMQRAYESVHDCHNPKGTTIGVAFGIGGYGGVYSQKCKSPLGQRYTIYRIHGGPALGIGGVGAAPFAGLNFTRDIKEPNHSRPFHARLNTNMAGAAGVGGSIDASVSGGTLKKVGQNEEERKQNISQPSTTIAPAVGWGIYAGVGAEFDYRSKSDKPDFDPLFRALRLYK